MAIFVCPQNELFIGLLSQPAQECAHYLKLVF